MLKKGKFLYILSKFVVDGTLCELVRAHTGYYLEQDDVTRYLPPKPIKETKCHIFFLKLSPKAELYFRHYKWTIALLGCSMKLVEDGQPRGSTPKSVYIIHNITMNNHE